MSLKSTLATPPVFFSVMISQPEQLQNKGKWAFLEIPGDFLTFFFPFSFFLVSSQHTQVNSLRKMQNIETTYLFINRVGNIVSHVSLSSLRISYHVMESGDFLHPQKSWLAAFITQFS